MAETPASSNNQPPSPPGGANANMRISAAGLAALRASEGQKNGGGYYNDSANNCTVGTGILVHRGPCTAEELARHVDPGNNERTFMERVAQAEADVRAQVTDRPLTQDQFDALVSARFNLGPVGVRPITQRANANDDPGVARALLDRAHVRPRDSHGRPAGPMVLNQGLLNRRQREAQPFMTQQPQSRP